MRSGHATPSGGRYSPAVGGYPGFGGQRPAINSVGMRGYAPAANNMVMGGYAPATATPTTAMNYPGATRGYYTGAVAGGAVPRSVPVARYPPGMNSGAMGGYAAATKFSMPVAGQAPATNAAPTGYAQAFSGYTPAASSATTRGFSNVPNTVLGSSTPGLSSGGGFSYGGPLRNLGVSYSGFGGQIPSGPVRSGSVRSLGEANILYQSQPHQAVSTQAPAAAPAAAPAPAAEPDKQPAQKPQEVITKEPVITKHVLPESQHRRVSLGDIRTSNSGYSYGNFQAGTPSMMVPGVPIRSLGDPAHGGWFSHAPVARTPVTPQSQWASQSPQGMGGRWASQSPQGMGGQWAQQSPQGMGGRWAVQGVHPSGVRPGSMSARGAPTTPRPSMMLF